MPFLKSIKAKTEEFDTSMYPYNIPAFCGGEMSLLFENNITFFIGENGSGKSTLLEAIADQCGFNLAGGNRNHSYSRHHTESCLASAIKLIWFPKVTDGFFMRGESFFNFATYVDEMTGGIPGHPMLEAYGGKSLHQISHGESFLALFQNKFKSGIFLLDEPESALSIQRQLSFLTIINELNKEGKSQFIIATHSPILLSYPNANIFRFSNSGIEKVRYEETEPYKLTKEFLNCPERYFKHLFSD